MCLKVAIQKDMCLFALDDRVMHHSFHASTLQVGITICFMDGREGDLLGYLCGNSVTVTRFPLSQLQRDHSVCQIFHQNWTGKQQASERSDNNLTLGTLEMSRWAASKNVGSLSETIRGKGKKG